MGIRAL